MAPDQKKKIICHDISYPIYHSLRCYEQAGIPLILEGRHMSATAIARACAFRESCYMLDFVPDSSGLKVGEIHLDQVYDKYKPETDSPPVRGKRERSGRTYGLR